MRRFVRRFLGLASAAARDVDISAEFESNLELHIADNVRAGMTEEGARRAALLAFGSVEAAKESVRDQSTVPWLRDLWRDTRYGLRSLRHSPVFTAAAILSLAPGLGASIAILTIADHLLVRPLPYPDSSKIVMVWEANTRIGSTHNSVSAGNYLDWKTQNSVFEHMAAIEGSRVVVVEGSRAAEFGRQRVAADFLPMLRVQPVLGRWFSAEEDRGAVSGQKVALISYRVWQSWFDGDRNVAGRTLEVNGESRTIIGVLPQNFYFLDRDVDIWEPLGLDPSQNYRESTGRYLRVAARLRSGTSFSSAQTQMKTIARRLETAYPRFNTNWTSTVEPLRDALVGDVKTPLLVLLGAVAMMLAVACANVAGLLLARFTARRREIAVRASIGASRWRLVRQLFTESVLLSAAGGLVGVLLARWGVAAMVALAPAGLVTDAGISLDGRILAGAVCLVFLTSVFFGVAPVAQAARVDPISSLRGDERAAIGAGARIRSWLVATQIAMSVMLLIGAVLLFRSLIVLESVRPGHDTSNVLTFRVSLAGSRYPETQPGSNDSPRTRFFRRGMDEIARLPAVRSVSAVSWLPLNGPGSATDLAIEGRPPAKPGEGASAAVRSVMPGYFRALGIPLMSGRDFTDSDDTPLSPYRFIVSEAFVRRYLNGEHPLGKRISVDMEDKNPFGEIIGVVGDVRDDSIVHEPRPEVYYIHSHLEYGGMNFLVRVDRDPMALKDAVSRVIRRLDPEEPVAGVQSLEGILGENYARQRFSTWLLSVFAVAALVLAGVGIFGLLAYSVTARTREFGLRAALGAEPGRIVTDVLAAGLWPVAGGLIAGLAGAFALTGLLKSVLFATSPRDPATFVAVPLILGAIALGAAWLPARRAARVDPGVALRAD